MLDVREFLRVRNATNGLNLPSLDFNRQHGKGARTCASNQGRLTIDGCQLKTSVLWYRASEHPPAFQKEARHRHPPGNQVPRRSFDLAAAIAPEGDLFGQQVQQGGHRTFLHRLQKTGEQLLLGFGRDREAWPVGDKVFLRPAERLSAGPFIFAQKGGNLCVVVLEDLAQQEDGSLDGLELLQEDQKCQRDRLIRIDAPLDLGECIRGRRDDRFWQPGTQVLFPRAPRELKLIQAQVADDRRQKGLE